ncbi:MAG TPA: hypothetical protein VNU72_14425, partial [Puia sp.]|nr:hypothetical protein [Puia sp.]
MTSSMNHKDPSPKALADPAPKPFVRRFLYSVLLFLLGTPVVSHASPGIYIPPYVFTVTVILDNQIADGTHNDIVEVTVTDGGLPAPGVSVNFKLQGATASNSLTTNAAGIVDYPVNSNVAGITTVSVTVNGVTQIVSVSFIAGPPSANPPGNPPGGTIFIVTQDNQPADGVSQDVVKAHISDQFGNPVGVGVSVVFTITGGVASGTAKFQPNSSTTTYTGTTDANGDIFLPITSTIIGDAVIHATLGGVDIFNSPQSVHFVVGPPSPNPPGNPVGGTNFFITQNNQAADGASQDKVKAHISDATGNSVGAGVLVTITITGNGTAAGNAQLPGNVLTVTLPTDVNGDVVVPITDIKSGTVELSAWIVDPVTGILTQIHGSTQTVTFVAGPPSPNPPGNPAGGTNFFIITNNQAADGVAQDQVGAHISDANGNSVGAGVQVTITVTGNGTAAGSANLPGNVKTIVVTTDVNGNVVIPITDILAGTVELSASIVDPVTSVLTQIFGSTQTVTFVVGQPSPNPPGNPPGGTNFIITQDNQTADGVSQDKVKAHISDANGNPVGAGVLVTITITGNGTAAGQANLPGNVKTVTVATDANGDVVVPITDILVGTVEMSASIVDPVTGNPTFINGSTKTVTFVVGAPSPNPPGNPVGG